MADDAMIEASDDLRRGQVGSNMENSMDQLQNSFQRILHLKVEEGTVAAMHTEPSSTTETSSFTLSISAEENSIGYHGLRAKDRENLKCIALRMNSKGRLDKLVSVYVKERKSFANMRFRKLWDEKLSSSDIEMLECKVMEEKIKRWIRVADYSLRHIFAYEKQLSSQVFKDLGNATDDFCFISTVCESATRLFDFAEAISRCRRLPERLQILLLLYRSFSYLMPEINSVFEPEKANSIRDRATLLLCNFAEVVRSTFLDVGEAVLHARYSDHIPGGIIHDLTTYVMDHIIGLVAENREILEGLITTRPSRSLGSLDCSELQRQTPLTAHLLWIITALQQNLEDKSKYYQDPFSHLFMVNNVHYIARQIGQSEVLREMVGDDHIRKLTEYIEDSLTSYLSTTWNGLLYCFRNEGLHSSWSFSSGVSKKVLKERFDSFNAMLQEVLRAHLIWTVPDLELRNKLHRSILDKLIPSYRIFVEQFGSHIEGSCPGRYIVYSVEELEANILGLFRYHEFL